MFGFHIRLRAQTLSALQKCTKSHRITLIIKTSSLASFARGKHQQVFAS
jgi:hypothetical protein